MNLATEETLMFLRRLIIVLLAIPTCLVAQSKLPSEPIECPWKPMTSQDLACAIGLSSCFSSRQRSHERQFSSLVDFVRFPIMCQEGIDIAKLSLPPEFRLGGVEPVGDTGVILRPQPQVRFGGVHTQ